MSPQEIGKILGAVVLALGIAGGACLLSRALVPEGKLAVPVYKVPEPPALEAEASAADKAPAKTAAKGEAAPATAALTPIGPLLAAADPAAGEKTASRCAVCHSFGKGEAAKVGPNLYGIIGAPRAHMEGFAYSEAMKQAGGVWDYESLNRFLTSPKAAIKGTKMAFPGLPNAPDRANVIAWLRSKADVPAPLP